MVKAKATTKGGNIKRQPKATIETIDKKTADRALARNSKNRPMSEGLIKKLCGQLEAGEFDLNGESIIFGTGGELIDGQHRLKAISRTGIPAQSVVVRGVLNDAFLTIDSGRGRTGGETLAVAGHKYANTLSSALRWIHKYDTGRMRSAQSYVGKGQWTNRRAFEMLDDHPGIIQSVEMVAKTSGAGKRPRLAADALMAALHYIMCRMDQEDADVFMDSLMRGTGLEEDSPIYALRERMLAELNKGPGVDRMTQQTKALIVIRAWNAYREGRSLKRMDATIRSGSDFPEAL